MALFGLVASTPSLLTALLPHFLAFWIVSIPLDVVWLIHRSDQARSIVITLMGINMCFKLVSAGQAARILQSHGALPDVGSTAGFGAGRSGQPWLNGGGVAPFGLPGSWSAQGGYRDGPASAAPYQSIYDEEARADERDAPQVHVDNVASNVAAAAAARGQGKEGPGPAQYSAIG